MQEPKLLDTATSSHSTESSRNALTGDALGEKSRSVIVYILIAASLLVLIQTFTVIAPIVLSLLLTLVLSLSLNPIVVRLRCWTGGRSSAAGVVIVCLIVILALSALAFVGPLRSSASDLAEALPTYWERLQKPLIKWEQQAVQSEQKLQDEVSSETKDSVASQGPTDEKSSPQAGTTETKQATSSLRANLSETLRGIVGSVAKAAFNGSQIFVVLVTVFFGVIFTLMDPRPVFTAIFLMVPERYHPKALAIMRRIGRFAPAWGGSMLMGMITIGVLVVLMMWPIFGFKDAIVLGLIAGIFESIPFIGPILSTVPALLLAVGQGGMTPLWVLIAFIVVQALENNVILPLIMARGMKLHSLAIIFSMLLCVTCFGALGVIVAAPMATIVAIVHEELFRKKYLSTTTDDDLNRLARITLGEQTPA